MLFGGTGATDVSDVWEWDGFEWRYEYSNPTGDLDPLQSSAMGYDPGTKRVLLFGGSEYLDRSERNMRFIDESWQWLGSRWEKLESAARPGPRAGHGMT